MSIVSFVTQPPAETDSNGTVILGGSGFIGTRLTALLVEQKIRVRIGDRRPSGAFPHLWTECDVRQRESLDGIVRGVDAIVNLAAEHRDDVRPLSLYHATNVAGATSVCEAARTSGVEKIVFTSSVAVYGFHDAPVNEDGPFEPFNEYGKTKLEAENIYRAWAAEDPKRTLVIVRPSVVFGEGNRGNVYNLLHQIASGRFLMVGSGENVKSIAYVENVAEFLVHALRLGSGTHIFNYADGPDMNTRDLVEYIKRCLGSPRKISSIPKPVAMAGGHAFDAVSRLTGKRFPISAIRIRKFCESTQFRADRAARSGFVPRYSLQESLERTIRFEFPAGALSAKV